MARLTRARIAAAGLALLDDEGLGGVTARALAARLGVQAGALYHHLPDMRAVLDAMATEMMREMQAPGEVGPTDWADLVRAQAHRTREVLLGHRDGARVFAGSRIDDVALLEPMEHPLSVLDAAGFEPSQAFWLLQSVLHYCVGFVIEEQHRLEYADSYDPAVRAARFDPDRTPLTVRAGAAMAADADVQFAFGLALIIDGARTRLPT